MKHYEKPMLTALSLNGNDQLCGYCSDEGAAYLLYDDTELAKKLMADFVFGDVSDGISRKDFEGVFGSGESGCSTREIIGYCKFTSVGTLVAWS